MRFVKPEVKFEEEINGEEILKKIEKIGRVCYKSEDKITKTSSAEFIRMILKSGHESVIEHHTISVRVVCDRGVSHEIVRHRIASYSQESTRYCNYSKNRFESELRFIEPCFWNSKSNDDNQKQMILNEVLSKIEDGYMNLISLGASPQEARAILPNLLKTEIVMSMNLREWRHFLKLRSSKSSHPQMREIAFLILNKFKEEIPVLFDDISI